MSQKQVFTCDECGAQKKETNHWVLVWDEFECSCPPVPILRVRPWTDAEATKERVKHFCGAPDACLWVGKRINEWQQGEK